MRKDGDSTDLNKLHDALLDFADLMEVILQGKIEKISLGVA